MQRQSNREAQLIHWRNKLSNLKKGVDDGFPKLDFPQEYKILYVETMIQRIEKNEWIPFSFKK